MDQLSNPRPLHLACRRCEHSLVGLPATEVLLTCPECGQLNDPTWHPERRPANWCFLSLWPWPMFYMSYLTHAAMGRGPEGAIAGAVAVSGLSLALQVLNPWLRGRIRLHDAVFWCIAGNLLLALLFVNFLPRFIRV